MAYTPISNAIIQYSKDAAGTSASGYYLKFYEAGSNTPFSMASASDGSGLLAKCQINSIGYPINGSGDVFIPFVNQDYRIVLYANSADADANSFGSAIYDIDNVPRQITGDSTSFVKFSDLSLETGSSLIGYDQGSSDSVATTAQEYMRRKVYVEDFGVDGTASAEDEASWQAAVDYALANDVELCATAGKTYLFDPDVNGGVGGNGVYIIPEDGQSFYFNGNMATFKFAVMNDYPGRGWHMMLVVLRTLYGSTNVAADNIVFKNMVVDGNYRNQPTPAGISDYEQRSALKVQAFAGEGNTINFVRFENIIQVDPMADTIVIGPSDTNTVDGEAAIRNGVIDGFHAGKRDSQRAAFIFGSGVERMNVSNVTYEKATGSVFNAIETEYVAIGAQRPTINLTNVYMEEIELSGAFADPEATTVNMTNCVASELFLMVYGNINAENCTLAIGNPATMQIPRFKGNNIRWLHKVYDAGGGVTDVRTMSHSTSLSSTTWKESNSEHIVDGTLVGAFDNPLFNTSNKPAAEVDDHVFEFTNVTFDPAAYRGIDAFSGGTVKTSNCIMGGTNAAIQVGSFSTFAGSWHSSNDDFSKVTGDAFNVNSSVSGGAGSEVRINGGIWPSFDFATGGSFWESLAIQSNRTKQVSAAPTGGGLVGDIVQLDSTSYAAASSSADIRWLCVDSNATAATWISIATKP